MTIWLIEPRDPLIFRNGKPFGPTPGASAYSLVFPFPSTIAGGVRSQAARDSDGAFRIVNSAPHAGQPKDHPTNQLQRLTEEVTIRGPLLTEIPQSGADITPAHWLVPAPRDVVIYRSEKDTLTEQQIKDEENYHERYLDLERLTPITLPHGSLHDLQNHKNTGIQEKDPAADLLLVGTKNPGATPRKPYGDAPHYWTWKIFEQWLINPAALENNKPKLREVGHNGPERELRVHVSIDPYKHTGKTGALFNTSGLEFNHRREHGSSYHLKTTQPLGLVVLVQDTSEFKIQSGPGCLGSERRIVSWRRSTCSEPSCPQEIRKNVLKNKTCRLILLTPAHFTNGYLPAWSNKQPDIWSLQPIIKAIAVDRPQIVSGWDIVNRQPKKTRRLAPAGTVMFLSLEHASEEAIEKWISETWLQCISDEKQDRADGFGLAVLGTWNQGE